MCRCDRPMTGTSFTCVSPGVAGQQPVGESNPSGWLERPPASPKAERAVRERVERRSNPRLRFFRPPLNRLSIDPKTKRPGITL